MWKSHADAHFAIGVRHIHKYVEEQKADVYCPSHVVTALSYQGGLANSVAELYSIDRRSDGMQCIVNAAKEKRMCRMGRLSEISYEMCAGQIYAKGYEYSGGGFKEYVITPDYTCRRRQVENTQLHNHGKVGPQCQVVNDAFGEEMTSLGKTVISELKEFEVRPATDVDEEKDIEMVGEACDHDVNEGGHHDPIGGRSNSIQGSGDINVSTEYGVDDEIMLSTMTCMHVGKMTGVKIWSDGEVKWVRRRRSTFGGPIFDPFEEPEFEPSVDGNGESVTNRPTVYTCPRCRRQFSRIRPYERHVEECDGRKGQTTIDRAIGFSFDMISTGELVTYERCRIHPKLKDMKVDEDVLQKLDFKSGWARRPKQGESLGRNTVHIFIEDIERWFEEGNGDKGKKMSGAQTKAALELKYPLRYDLPTEQHVTNAINALTAANKRKKCVEIETVEQALQSNNAAAGHSQLSTCNIGNDQVVTKIRPPSRSRRSPMDKKYIDVLEGLVEANPQIKPKDGVKIFLNHFGLKNTDELGEGWPTEAQIKSKISRLKTIAKDQI